MDVSSDKSYGLLEPVKFKISVLGDMAVGKTCLSLRFVRDTFQETHRPTISDIESKSVRIQDHHVVYQIWDTAGQERFRSLLPLYMKGVDGAIVVYDITSKRSFENVKLWYTEIQKHATEHTVVMVVGNKLDMATEYRNVTISDGECLSRQLGCLFHEASAKTGENVNSLFIKLGEEIVQSRLQYYHTESVHKQPNSSTNVKTSSCC